MIKRITAVLFCMLGLAVASFGQNAPGIKKHALPKALKAVGKAVVVAPKATLVGLKDTIGGVLFGAEAVIDVAHAGTTALSAVASKELKHNPFEYIDKGVAYADTGAEKAYLFFFHANI